MQRGCSGAKGSGSRGWSQEQRQHGRLEEVTKKEGVFLAEGGQCEQKGAGEGPRARPLRQVNTAGDLGS